MKIEIIDDPKLNALGEYFDEHGEGEWKEAESKGEVYSVNELGCKTAFEAAAKIKADRKMYSFRLPVLVVEGLKKKAKKMHKPYQRLVNEVLAQAAF